MGPHDRPDLHGNSAALGTDAPGSCWKTLVPVLVSPSCQSCTCTCAVVVCAPAPLPYILGTNPQRTPVGPLLADGLDQRCMNQCALQYWWLIACRGTETRIPQRDFPSASPRQKAPYSGAWDPIPNFRIVIFLQLPLAKITLLRVLLFLGIRSDPKFLNRDFPSAYPSPKSTLRVLGSDPHTGFYIFASEASAHLSPRISACGSEKGGL